MCPALKWVGCWGYRINRVQPSERTRDWRAPAPPHSPHLLPGTVMLWGMLTLLSISGLTLGRLLFSFLPTYRNVIFQVGGKRETEKIDKGNRFNASHAGLWWRFMCTSGFGTERVSWKSFHFKGHANLAFTCNEGRLAAASNDFNAATEQSVFLFSTLAIWFKHDLNRFKLWYF